MRTVLDICLCGAQAGYPHDPACPYPQYRTTEDIKWFRQYSRAIALAEMNAQRHCPQCGGSMEPDSPPETRMCRVCWAVWL